MVIAAGCSSPRSTTYCRSPSSYDRPSSTSSSRPCATIAPDVDPEAVDPRAPLVDQLDLDSMDYQNFLAAISSRFQIAIPATDVARLQTLAEVAAYVTAHRAPP